MTEAVELVAVRVCETDFLADLLEPLEELPLAHRGKDQSLTPNSWQGLKQGPNPWVNRYEAVALGLGFSGR